MRSKLKIIYTGGTLGMVPGVKGLLPAGNLSERLNDALKASPSHRAQLKDISWLVLEKQPLLDSANITPADWEIIAHDCLSAQDVNAIVIIHGTDTLAFTASALAFLLSISSIPIIITGSQNPLGSKNSDALNNLIGAMSISIKTRPGVWVFFNQKLLPASRVVKRDAFSFDGFDAPRFSNDSEPPRLQTHLHWQATPRDWNNFHIPIVYFSPGFETATFSALLATKPCAMVLVLYGFGALADTHSSLLDAILAAQKQSIMLVAVSQCYIGRIDFTKYATGSRLSKLGVLAGHDMTLEAAYTKLMVLFRMGYSAAEIKSLFGQSLLGELSHEA